MTIKTSWQKRRRTSRMLCCQPIKTRALVVSLALNWLVLSIPNPVSAVTVPEWKLSCREGFILQRDLRFSEAYNKYKEALSKIGSVDNANSREIQLNMAVMLRESKQYSRSLELLQTLTPRFENDKTSMQTLRFWRRLRDVYRDLKDPGHAIRAERKIIAIAKEMFEAGSPICLDETRILIELLGDTKQYVEAAALATQIKQVIPQMAPNLHGRFSFGLDMLNTGVIATAQGLKDQHKYKESLDML